MMETILFKVHLYSAAGTFVAQDLFPQNMKITKPLKTNEKPIQTLICTLPQALFSPQDVQQIVTILNIFKTT